MSVPSAGCMTCLLMTSQSCRFMALPNSSAANSATRGAAGRNRVTTTQPSAAHSTSGLMRPFSRSSAVCARRALTLSSGSSSSMNGTLSASHSVQPPMRSQGLPASGACAGPPRVVPLRQVVLAEVVAHRRQVVGGARHDRARRDAAVALAGDAVVVGLGVDAGVDEVRLLDGAEVAAVLRASPRGRGRRAP